ncbi:hypothetical protein EQV77_05100 [Halobacillus fulvus]|nr:hypothetical protein EQV77_05100 [Halobacillus fulvus]
MQQGGSGNGETPMGRKGQAEIPQEQGDEEAQRPPMESELFPDPPPALKRERKNLLSFFV